MHPQYTACAAGQYSPSAPIGAPVAQLDTLHGCLEVLADTLNVATDIAGSITITANRLRGSEPEQQAGTKPGNASLGYIDDFASTVRTLNGVLSEINRQHQRIIGALSA